MSSTERYRLVRTVASGGMAQVVEAVARGIDGFERRVAIKRLLPQHARDGERRRMFLEEARIGSRLHHGGIVPIFDYGLIDGSEFLAMEFVDGLDALRAVSGSEKVAAMPEGIALHIVAEIGHALAYIHDLRDDQGRPLGIVHRDVSPPNILLSWDGDVKLSDFGIALSGWRRERTVDGAVKGKLTYMAPEQALGKRVSSPADVYALGATLDALLGGQSMSPAMTNEEIAQRVEQAAARGVSPPVCVLIGACMARDPEHRPNAADVAARAGALASRRLGRDGRGALRSWLQPLRPKAQKQSALDDLMGLCLVPVGPGGARTFTVSQVWQPGRLNAVVEAPPKRVNKGRRAMRVALSVVAVGAVVAAWGVTRYGPHQPGVTSTPTMTVEKEVAHQTPSRQVKTAPSIPVVHIERTRPDEGAARARRGGVRPHVSASSVVAARADALMPPTGGDKTQQGWLRVGGPTYAGFRVTVDGAPAGFAPLEISLAAGNHTIAVSDPASGRVALKKPLHIGEHHTRTTPLQILR